MNNPSPYIVIGVDPGGSSGAIAIIQDGSLRILGMNGKTEHDIKEFIFGAILRKQMGSRTLAAIERVNAMPDQGVVSSFKFGQNYGFVRGCLVSHDIPFLEVLPKEWQKLYSMTKKKEESKKEWKTRLLNIARNLYPKADIPLYAADAVLLSHYALNHLT
jgi:crossover junction endodeoxyribonuclease RuvC